MYLYIAGGFTGHFWGQFMDGIGEQIDINMNISSLCIRDDGLSKNQAKITYEKYRPFSIYT